jgi:hypothetical protein
MVPFTSLHAMIEWIAVTTVRISRLPLAPAIKAVENRHLADHLKTHRLSGSKADWRKARRADMNAIDRHVERTADLARRVSQ